MVRQVIQKVSRNLGDYGIKVTVVKSILHIISPIYEFTTYRIYRIDLETAPKPSPLNDTDIIVRLLAIDDIDLILQIENYAEFLQGRIQKVIAGHGFCLVAVRGDELAGFNLISSGKVYMPLVKLHRVFAPAEAWSEHIAILPNFRRKGLASHLRHIVFEELRCRQFKRLYGGTLKSNKASLKLAERVGFRVFADIEYIGILWCKFQRYRRIRDDTNRES